MILAIDQGTTGTRAILYSRGGRVVSQAYQEIRQHFPRPGWVEHEPEELWGSTLAVIRRALAAGRVRPAQVAGIGITNQRETTILWERRTGRPIHRAIVWQDRRTADFCRQMKGREPQVRRTTGLVLDPYFSGTKIRWLLRNVPGAERAARAGRLCFGTPDSWLLWKLTSAICLAPMTLANAGLLKGKKATIWKDAVVDFKTKGVVYTGKPVERDGRIITGSGPEAAEEFGKALLEELGCQD